MSTRISSLSMRTTVPSTTSPCLKLLMSESCSASSSSIVVGSGPVGRFATTGASSSASMSEAGGASETSSATSAACSAGASATAAAATGASAVSSAGLSHFLGRGLGDLCGRCRCVLGLGGRGRRGRRLCVCRDHGVGRLALGGELRLGAGLGGGGLVGHGDGRNGLLGRRGLAGGRRLRRRRGPALLFVGQGDPVSFMEFTPGITNGRRTGSGAVWGGRGIVGDLGRRSAPSR